MNDLDSQVCHRSECDKTDEQTYGQHYHDNFTACA